METLILNFKSKKNYMLVKELAALLEAKKSGSPSELKGESLPKSKFKSKEEFLSYAGCMKGQLISKEHLRNLSWKKRD
jgi:hypothetical protein